MNNRRKDESQSIYTIGSQRNLVPIRSTHACFKRRTLVPNVVIFIIIFSFTICFLIILLLSILNNLFKQKQVCETEECMRVAASLKESMDVSVDPCDDFYKFTCGRWSREHPIPDSSLTNSWFSERSERVARQIRDSLRQNITNRDPPWAVAQAKILYESCMDVHSLDNLGLDPLFELLAQLGLPLIPPLFTKATGDSVEQAANVKKILGKDVFFALDVTLDPRNNSRNVLLLDIPVMSSPLPNNVELEKRLKTVKSRLKRIVEDDEEDLDDFLDSDELRDAELKYITVVIQQVLNNGTVDTCALNQSIFEQREIDAVADIIYELGDTLFLLGNADSNESLSEETVSDLDYMLVDDLQRITNDYVRQINSSLTPKIIWRPFIEYLYKDIVTLNLDEKDKILVGNLDYVKDVALVFALTQEEELETYIWWSVVDTVAPHSAEGLRKAWSDYVNTVVEIEVGESRSLQCASATNSLMGMAVSWLFVEPSFQQKKQERVLEMLEDIRQAFASLVRNANWMDGGTKRATLEKNRKMASVIGFPKWLFEDGALDEYYEGIDLSETSYLGNMIQIARLSSMSDLKCIRKINYSNETIWATDPTDVNAFHTFQVNQITIPAGILQFPFYDLGLEALNYGAIGTVLGHELTHGFDNSGRHYDSEGNLRQWWSNETISEYTARTKCFIEQYSNYYEDEVDDYIDGELTLGENIADNGGLREAVIAYSLWKARHGAEALLPGFTHFSHEQLLFLGFAHLWCESYTAESLKWMLQDSHCPGHVRLQAVLRNSQEFSEAWNCASGSNMNPTKKCNLW